MIPSILLGYRKLIICSLGIICITFTSDPGTIYETTSTDLDTTTKMGNHFGGTWEAYGAGRVLVAKSSDTEFDTIGETGGAKTHTLSEAEMPVHSHLEYATANPNSGGDGTRGTFSGAEGSGMSRYSTNIS